MTEHTLIALALGVFGCIQLAGLVVLGLQLREARRETQRLAGTMAQMALGMDALARRLG